MTSLISICIPTYKRPELLVQAIESCLAQTYPTIEIIICDDAQDDATERLVRDTYHSKSIRYYRNQPSLRQAGNVNRLFDLAQGERLVLLHDDDLLMPDAISQMVDCWSKNPDITVCFGKQYIIDMSGEVNEAASRDANEFYQRTHQHQGIQDSTLRSAIVGQIPNNGFMIRTEAARQTRYRGDPQVGDACDYDFALRLATQSAKVLFLDTYIAKYRITSTAISRNNNYAHLSFDLLAALTVPDSLESTRNSRMRQCASAAVNKWLTLGERRKAAAIYYSSYYPPRNRYSLKGIIQFFLTMCPAAVSRLFMLTVLHKQS